MYRVSSFFPRNMAATLQAQAEQYPVVSVFGPRQSGKTTLCRSCFPDKAYFNLEEPDTRDFIVSDPRRFFQDNAAGAIIDEIQHAPELMSYIQAVVDEQKQNGVFIITGSQQIDLHAAVSQSLAGRTAILELLPLSLTELDKQHVNLTLDEYLLKGFYPAIYVNQLDATVTSRNYIRTYVERDVRKLNNIKDLHAFQRFMQLCAGRVGSILSKESLSNDAGVSAVTIESWLSILEASFLMIRLQPYFENFGKRVIKSPKIYCTDVGLLSYLLGIETTIQMSRDPMRGHLFENLVILELIKYRFNQGKDSNLYYYRDNHQNEVDVIIKQGNQLIPIEIKSTMTFNSSQLKNIQYYQKIAGDRAPVGFLVYAGDQEMQIGNCYVINFKKIFKIHEILASI